MVYFKIAVPGRENQDIDVLNQYHTITPECGDKVVELRDAMPENPKL
jgi:hypothetical protein